MQTGRQEVRYTAATGKIMIREWRMGRPCWRARLIAGPPSSETRSFCTGLFYPLVDWNSPFIYRDSEGQFTSHFT